VYGEVDHTHEEEDLTPQPTLVVHDGGKKPKKKDTQNVNFPSNVVSFMPGKGTILASELWAVYAVKNGFKVNDLSAKTRFFKNHMANLVNKNAVIKKRHNRTTQYAMAKAG
jgi:hypothetical protein